MKNIQFIALLSFGMILFAACGTDGENGTAKADYDTIANDFCNCMQPLVDINTKIKGLLAEKKQEEVEALFGQVQALSKKSEPCVKKLESSLATLSPAQQNKAGETMKDVCPDVAKMVTAAKNRELK